MELAATSNEDAKPMRAPVPPVLKVDRQLAYSVNEAATACAVRPHAIRKAIKFFELTPVAIGRRSVILRDDLQNWLRSRPRTKSPRKKEATP
jgi:hypothetical protein